MIGGRLGRLISADDIVQEAFIQASQSITSFQPEGPDAFYAWLRTIAVNRLRDEGRRQRRLKRGGDRRLAESPNRDQDGEYADLVAELSDAGDLPSRVAAGHEAVRDRGRDHGTQRGPAAGGDLALPAEAAAGRDGRSHGPLYRLGPRSDPTGQAGPARPAAGLDALVQPQVARRASEWIAQRASEWMTQRASEWIARNAQASG